MRIALDLRKVIALLLLTNCGSIAFSSESSHTPPLLETARSLHCAANQSDADKALQQLKSNTIADLNIPNEWHGTDHKPGVHAATFDIVIDVILANIQRFPQTTEVAESVILGWNYCAVHHSGKYFDLFVNDGKLTRKRANEDAPRQWSGLEQLGISLKGRPGYTPKAFSHTQKFVRQQLVTDWWEIQRNQCLPHPGTGELYYKKTLFGPSKIPSHVEEKSTGYPYAWTEDCALPHTNKDHQPQKLELTEEQTHREEAQAKLAERVRAHTLRQALKKQKTELEATQMQQSERDYKLARQLKYKTRQTTNAETTDKQTTERYEANSNNITNSIAGRNKNAEPGTMNPEVLIEAEPPRASALDGSEQEFGKNLQSTPPVNSGSAFPGGSSPPFADQQSDIKNRKYHDFSGSFALSNASLDSDNDAWSITASVGYKPIRESHFFARSGINWKTADSDPTYYWGLGYNDWHTGTWAFELNQWGPLKPGDGLQLANAVASISYKFDSSLLKKAGLSSSFAVSGGKSATPTATFAGSWSPKPNWFLRTLLTQPLEGGDTTWAYGFGYSDWRDKTWALEYNNYGSNKAFDINFRKNALVTMSWKWGF